MTKDKDLIRGFDTKCLHSGYLPDATTSRGVPLYRTAPYVFKDTETAAKLFGLQELGNIYTRLMNPYVFYIYLRLLYLTVYRTTDILEQRFCALEGGAAAVAVASGTSACFYAIITLAEQGDSFVSSNNLYGGTFTQFHDILPKFGITPKFVNITDLDAVRNSIDDTTRAIFCETCSNPAMEIPDLEALAEIGKEFNIPLIVDDTFTTPYLCRPFEHGASIVCHSLTKWTGGHGTGIGGIVVDAGTFPWAGGKHPLFTEPDSSYGGLRWGLDLPEPLAPIAFALKLRTGPLRNLGACISPDNSWMFLQGIETLPLRMERHCENALKVAKFLKSQTAVQSIRYPGLEDDKEYEKNLKYLDGKGGSIVIFELEGGAKSGKTFIDNLKLFSHVANVGDAKSLAIHPATTTHSQMSTEEQSACGITPGLIRLSIGIESIEDITDDLEQSLASTEASLGSVGGVEL